MRPSRSRYRPLVHLIRRQTLAEHVMDAQFTPPTSSGRHHRCGFRLKKHAWTGVVFLLAEALSAGAAATHVQVEGGRSYMDSAGATAVFAEAVFAETPIGSSRFSWAPDISVGWIDRRDLDRYRNASYATNNASWLVAGGVRVRVGSAADWYHPLFFSFQPALHTGTTLALSSVYEFVSTIGWQGRRFSFQVRHISNGSLRGPNRGETMALVGVGFDL